MCSRAGSYQLPEGADEAADMARLARSIRAVQQPMGEEEATSFAQLGRGVS